jgi:hypothetical protein
LVLVCADVALCQYDAAWEGGGGEVTTTGDVAQTADGECTLTADVGCCRAPPSVVGYNIGDDVSNDADGLADAVPTKFDAVSWIDDGAQTKFDGVVRFGGGAEIAGGGLGW